MNIIKYFLKRKNRSCSLFKILHYFNIELSLFLSDIDIFLTSLVPLLHLFIIIFILSNLYDKLW